MGKSVRLILPLLLALSGLRAYDLTVCVHEAGRAGRTVNEALIINEHGDTLGTTDSLGTCPLVVPDTGEFTVIVWAEGFTSDTSEFLAEFNKHRRQRLDFYLFSTAPATLSWEATDARTGKRIPNATLRLTDNVETEVIPTTRESLVAGIRFNDHMRQYAYHAELTAPGYSPRLVEAFLHGNDTTRVATRLYDTGFVRIDGYVRDPYTGRGIFSAVMFAAEGPVPDWSGTEIRPTFTDRVGYYVFDSIPPGHYSILLTNLHLDGPEIRLDSVALRDKPLRLDFEPEVGEGKAIWQSETLAAHHLGFHSVLSDTVFDDNIRREAWRRYKAGQDRHAFRCYIRKPGEKTKQKYFVIADGKCYYAVHGSFPWNEGEMAQVYHPAELDETEPAGLRLMQESDSGFVPVPDSVPPPTDCRLRLEITLPNGQKFLF